MIGQEISRTLRSLSRAPRFSAIVVVTLALAVGGAGGLFSLLDAAVLRTLPVRDPERLVAVFPANGEALFGISMPTLAAFAGATTGVLDGVCGVSQGSALVVEIGGVNRPRPAESVTGECARVLGLDAALGRAITPADAPLTGASAPVVVVGYRFWRDVLGGTPDVIGRTLRVEGQPLTIIGVLPEAYRGMNADEAPDISVPLDTMWRLRGGARVLALHLVGRLHDRITIDEARVQLRAVWPAVWTATNPQAAPGAASRAGLAENLRVEGLARGFSSLRGRYERALFALVALAALLVLLACANVGALCLARSISREPQLAVQMALGASRARVAAGLALEGVVLALCAAVAALPIAWWTSRAIALTLWTSPRPLTMEVTPAAPTFAVIAVTGFVAGVLVSAAPVLAVWLRQWQLSATHVRGVFGTTLRWRQALIAGQVATSFVLLFCAALFVTNLRELRGRDLGYAAEGLRFARLDLVFGAPRGYDFDTYVRTLVERVSALPQIDGAALSVAFPTSEMRHLTALFPIARDGARGDAVEAQGSMDRVSPGFLRVSGIPLLAGREFTWQDTAGAPPVAIITQPLAERLFADRDPVGQRIRVPARKPDVLTVVGVSADFSPGDPRLSGIPRIYVPMMQEPGASGVPAVLMRVRDARGLHDALAGAVAPLGRHQIAYLRSIGEQTDWLLTQERVTSALAAAFAGLGVLVGGLGLYAVLAHAVSRRTREMGLRMALGASRRTVLALVVREGVLMVLVGLAVGLPLALAGGRAARVLLFELSPYDARALIASMVVLVAVGVAAAVIPAARAARTELASALRCE
jgi:predicted permease